jgi:YHS domain-containing protein
VCAMVTSPARARATVTRGDKTYYFCSENCRDCFERDPDAYLGGGPLARAGEGRKGGSGGSA